MGYTPVGGLASPDAIGRFIAPDATLDFVSDRERHRTMRCYSTCSVSSSDIAARIATFETLCEVFGTR